MRKIYLGLLLIFVFSIISIITTTNFVTAEESIDLHMFYGQGCPHCSKLNLFLDEIKTKYPELYIHKHEIYNNNENRELFQKMAEQYGTTIDGVPTVFINDKIIVGFSNSIGKEIEKTIEENLERYYQKSRKTQVPSKTVQLNTDNLIAENPTTQNTIRKLTVPIVVTAAAVDAINPCAFAVLIILMTAALSITNKSKALKFGLAFSTSIYISYFLMGLGLFSALQLTGLSHKFYIIVTVLAIIVGLLNIKDFFWYGKGILMEVPLKWRPTMKKILNSVTNPIGAFIAGFAVSLFELPCTGGPYIVILGLLAKEASRQVGVLYLLLYNLVFISPLIILSIIIYKGFSTTERLEQIRQSKIRILHLIAGILMIGIATVMIISILKGWV